MLQIVVIDDGVDASRLSCRERLVEDLIVDEETKVVRERTVKDELFTQHGTICAKIIEKYAGEAEFISLCIFDDRRLKTDCEKLLVAMEWCLKSNVKLIHMSVGTRLLADYGVLQNVTSRLIQQGKMIIAAGNNTGTYTMPACLGGVLGVVADKALKEFDFRYCDIGNGIQIAASGAHSFLKADGISDRTIPANSYAAPTVTAAICRVLERDRGDGISIPNIFSLILRDSRYLAVRPDFVRDAVMINLSENSLLKEHFFFSYEEVGIDELCGYNVCGKRKCLIFLPGKEKEQNEKVLAWIETNRTQLYGIVYCGNGGCKWKEYMTGYLFWSEENCGILRWKPGRAMIEQQCPCVMIRTEQQWSIATACELQHQLRKRGYQCVTASTSAYSYLYGMEHIPMDFEKKQIISYLKEVFDPDIIILLMDKWETSWSEEKQDIYYVSEGENCGEELCEHIISYFA